MASNATQLGLGVLAAAAIGVAAVVVANRLDAPDDTATPAMSAPQAETVAAAPEGETGAEVAEAEVAADPEVAEIEAAVEPDATEPKITAEPEVADAVAETEADEDVAATEVTDEADPAPQRPSLDNFYLRPDGFATVAGRAEAGQLVAIMVAGNRFADVKADGTGAFATAILLDASDQPRRLSLLADPDGAAVASSESIMVAPTATVPEDSKDSVVIAGAVTSEPEETPVEEAATEVEVAVAEPVVESGAEPEDAAPEPVVETATVETAAPATDDAPLVVTVETAAEPESAQDPVVTAEVASPDVAAPEAETVAQADETPTQPTVLLADESGVRVVQGGTGPSVLSSIALDTITYDPSGEVVLAGRAAGSGFVQVYINNQPVKTTQIDAGNWQTDLPDIDTGVYTLRVDEVDAEGVVTSRIETPFKREEPEAVAAVMAEETAQDGFDVAVRTVQPGSTLWAIAQEEMGEGIMYVAVFEANRDLIRDPDLIYPGQVFRIPQMPDTGQ